MESIITTLLIDVHEGRDVAFFDTLGAYLHADLNVRDDKERVILTPTGNCVDIMCEVNPEHIVNVIYENGKKVLYMAILKVIYGCIESALRWYELFSQTLEKESFIINPYDRYIANAMINRKQCTIVWYINDNKLSHKDPKDITEILEIMKNHFG